MIDVFNLVHPTYFLFLFLLSVVRAWLSLTRASRSPFPLLNSSKRKSKNFLLPPCSIISIIPVSNSCVFVASSDIFPD